MKEDTEALVQLISSLFYDVPDHLQPGALNAFTEAVTEIHIRHGYGEPEWLGCLRAKLAEAAAEPETMGGDYEQSSG